MENEIKTCTEIENDKWKDDGNVTHDWKFTDEDWKVTEIYENPEEDFAIDV